MPDYNFFNYNGDTTAAVPPEATPLFKQAVPNATQIPEPQQGQSLVHLSNGKSAILPTEHLDLLAQADPDHKVVAHGTAAGAMLVPQDQKKEEEQTPTFKTTAKDISPKGPTETNEEFLKRVQAADVPPAKQMEALQREGFKADAKHTLLTADEKAHPEQSDRVGGHLWISPPETALVVPAQNRQPVTLDPQVSPPPVDNSPVGGVPTNSTPAAAPVATPKSELKPIELEPTKEETPVAEAPNVKNTVPEPEIKPTAPIESVKPEAEKIAQNLIDTGDVDKVVESGIKPEEIAKALIQKLTENSKVDDKFDLKTFIQNYEALEPEVKQMLGTKLKAGDGVVSASPADITPAISKVETPKKKKKLK